MYQQYTPTHATPVWKEADQLAEPLDLITISKPDQAELENSGFFSFLYRSTNSPPTLRITPKPQVVIPPFTRTDEHLDTTHLHQNTKTT